MRRLLRCWCSRVASEKEPGHPPLEAEFRCRKIEAEKVSRVHDAMTLSALLVHQNCTAFVNVAEKPIPKSTLSQHFRILREAGLIRSERHGVEMHNTSRAAEVDARYPGLLVAIAKAHEIQMTGQARKEKRAAKKQKAQT